MKTDNVALVDLDGTCVDYDWGMELSLLELASPEELKTNMSWKHGEEPQHILNRMKLIKSRSEWWATLPGINYGMALVNDLAKMGFRIVILTQGPRSNSEAWKGKVDWCLKFLPDTDIIITRDKSLVYGKILVDDYPPYAIDWLESRPRGYVFMPINQHNKDFEHPRVIKYSSDDIWEKKHNEMLKSIFKRKSGEPL